MDNFSPTNVSANMKHFHTFGCPVYALEERLQSNKPIASWNKRARLGINLGPSPRHTRNISLVLSLATGLISPQYDLVYDEIFETSDRRVPTPPKIWRAKAGLSREIHEPSVIQSDISSEGATVLTNNARTSNIRQASIQDPSPATFNEQLSTV